MRGKLVRCAEPLHHGHGRFPWQPFLVKKSPPSDVRPAGMDTPDAKDYQR